MKHDISYIFNPNYIRNVADVVSKCRKLGWDTYTYHKYNMADGTEHQFIHDSNEYIEVPDLNAALAFVVGKLSMLKEFVDAAYIIEETENV